VLGCAPNGGRPTFQQKKQNGQRSLFAGKGLPEKNTKWPTKGPFCRKRKVDLVRDTNHHQAASPFRIALPSSSVLQPLKSPRPSRPVQTSTATSPFRKITTDNTAKFLPLSTQSRHPNAKFTTRTSSIRAPSNPFGIQPTHLPTIELMHRRRSRQSGVGQRRRPPPIGTLTGRNRRTAGRRSSGLAGSQLGHVEYAP
jgi:hypothetical protein